MIGYDSFSEIPRDELDGEDCKARISRYRERGGGTIFMRNDYSYNGEIR